MVRELKRPLLVSAAGRPFTRIVYNVALATPYTPYPCDNPTHRNNAWLRIRPWPLKFDGLALALSSAGLTKTTRPRLTTPGGDTRVVGRAVHLATAGPSQARGDMNASLDWA